MIGGDWMSGTNQTVVENLESASPEEVRQATRGTYFIEIQTDNAG